MTRTSSLHLRQGVTFVLILLVPLAAIGPNIGNHGLRTEHVYAFVAAVVLLTIHGMPSRVTTAYWIVVFAWTAVFLVAFMGGFLPVESFFASSDRAVQEGLGRLGVPLLGLVIGAYAGLATPTFVRRHSLSSRTPLETMMTVLVIVACVNAILAVATVVNDYSWLAMFRADKAAPTVADRAAEIGRYGGVVNQPFEAGLLYSVALATVSRQWTMRIVGTHWFAGLFALVCLGGAMSGSKVFLFGGLPVALAYLLLGSGGVRVRRLRVAVLAAFVSGLAAWWALSQFNQRGLEGIGTLFSLWGSEQPGSTLFAGRLDSDGNTMELLSILFREAGPFGFGASGSVGAYDIGVVEFTAVAGWTGVAAMVLLSVALLVASVSHRRERYWPALSLLVVVANLGGPAFTANRSALVVWVLLGAMLQCGQRGDRAPDQVEAAIPMRMVSARARPSRQTPP